jgi:hypothetical protein
VQETRHYVIIDHQINFGLCRIAEKTNMDSGDRCNQSYTGILPIEKYVPAERRRARAAVNERTKQDLSEETTFQICKWLQSGRLLGQSRSSELPGSVM